MDKLAEIMAHKAREIESRIRPVRDFELARYADIQHKGKGFRKALSEAPGLGVISEIKRKSPSAGTIAKLPDASEQARLYYNAGTDAISVLTDETYFGGTIKDLWDVNDLLSPRSDAPATLRKDFFLHPIQVMEAAEAGARAILIIVRALSDEQIKALYDAANIAGLDSLFEIHEEAELERALNANAKIIGVNNRDLKRFVTDLTYSEKLIPKIPDDILKISESGIWTLEDATRAKACGAKAVLIGEAMMKNPHPEEFINNLHSL